jgi:hypothetical protein
VIELDISSIARNFNKRLDPISLDRFIDPSLSLAPLVFSRLDSFLS